MRNILQLFVRFGGLFLFILLEGICFFMVVQFNEKQNQIYFYSYNRVVGSINDWYNSWMDYIHLDDAIQELREENARLRTQLETYGFSDEIKIDTLNFDSAQFIYVGADVVNKTILGHNNSLTLDKGSKHGIDRNMGVVCPKGIVGIVTNVSENYAGVMTILHKESRISASIKRTGYFGSLVWGGTDPTRASLETLPRHASIQYGDTIQTSGYSNVFPPGIIIGTVEHFEVEEGANNYTVDVKLTTDISNIKQAYIIINKNRKELQNISEE